MTIPHWLNWAQRLQAIAQTGLSYQPHIFDQQRYEQIMALAAEMITAESVDAAPGDATAIIRTMMDAQIGHATPKVDVRGVIVREGRILLVQEINDGGRWTLPGGWADIGESAGESVVREIYEETGYRARAVKLLAAYDRHKHDHPPMLFHAYKLFFLCELTDEVRQPDPRNIETGEIGWFAGGDIPAYLSTGRVTAAQIARFFVHVQQPQLPTDFD